MTMSLTSAPLRKYLRPRLRSAAVVELHASAVFIAQLGYGPVTMLEMPWNTELSEVPSAVAPAIMATAIKDAIRPYSIAVAPDWSFRKKLEDSIHRALVLRVNVFTK